MVRAVEEMIRKIIALQLMSLLLNWCIFHKQYLQDCYKKIGFQKLCTCKVPKFLFKQHNEWAARYIFISYIVIGNETRVAYDTSETKGQSIKWRHPAKVKPKQILTTQICSQCFGTDKAFYWLIFYNEVKQSINMVIVRHKRNCVQVRSSAEEYSWRKRCGFYSRQRLTTHCDCDKNLLNMYHAITNTEAFLWNKLLCFICTWFFLITKPNLFSERTLYI